MPHSYLVSNFRDLRIRCIKVYYRRSKPFWIFYYESTYTWKNLILFVISSSNKFHQPFFFFLHFKNLKKNVKIKLKATYILLFCCRFCKNGFKREKSRDKHKKCTKTPKIKKDSNVNFAQEREYQNWQITIPGPRTKKCAQRCAGLSNLKRSSQFLNNTFLAKFTICPFCKDYILHTRLGDHLKIHDNMNNDTIHIFNLDYFKQDPPRIDLTQVNQPIQTDEGLNYPSGSGMPSSMDEKLPQMPSSDKDEV